ncbi:MAG TPA: acyltransferase family protein [Cyclobacteriaceae bacterium]|nr:acyltransferase family protein [Cyclobacteriaceae bacterium]
MQTTLNKGRRHDLDWLRAIAILILLFYHTGMLFVPWDWHIKNNELSNSFRYWMLWLHEWRMPLLLFISGAGTYMALGKRSTKQFASERFRRLFIPLLFGMFIIVPPQIYFEHINTYSNYWEFYKTVFNFVPYPEGSFSWHHLWFIWYLLVYSILALPLLIYLRGPESKKLKDKLAYWMQKPLLLLFLPMILILITQVSLRPYFPDETHAFIDDWAYFMLYFCFFLFGMICYSEVKIWNSFKTNRKTILISAIIVLMPFYTIYLSFRGLLVLPFERQVLGTVFDVLATFVAWFWVAAVIAYGQQYLNKEHKFLQHINEGLYPFYILHQTIIIWIGFYICQLNWSVTVKFWLVSLLTLITCILIYLFLIRPVSAMRVLFGMKPKSNSKTG